MYDYYNAYGEKAKGIEPTEDLEVAVKNADSFQLIVYDTEKQMDVYDIRKDNKWNPKWIIEKIAENKAKEVSK